MTKNIVFVEHGGINKEFTLSLAKKLGFRIILATTKVSEILYKYVDPGDIVVTDTYNSDKLINDIRNFLNTKSIIPHVVISFKESSVIPTAALAEALNLRGVGLLAAKKSSQNKFAMRTALKNAGFNYQPKYSKINIFDSRCIEQIKEFKKPLVIKPLCGSSSHGVKKIDNNASIQKDIDDVCISMDPKDREVFKNFDGSMLIEEYINGEIISVDGIVVDHKPYIIGTTQFIMGKEPYFKQIGSYTPSDIGVLIIEKCKKMTSEVIGILNFDTCGFHCEWRIKNDQPYLLEIAARTVGGGILLGYEKVTGTNLIEQLFYALLNEVHKIEVKDNVLRCVLHKSVLPEISKNSKLTKLEGLKNIKNNRNVWNFLKFSSPGDILVALPATPTELYYYALAGENVENLLQQSKELESKIVYEVEKLI
jgi:biotin carboxylase